MLLVVVVVVEGQNVYMCEHYMASAVVVVAVVASLNFLKVKSHLQ